MQQSYQRPTWASRVSRYEIARLYHSDARGMRDEDLADEVGYGFLARIRDILKVTDAHRGRVHCPECDTVIPRPQSKTRMHADEQIVTCPNCGWQLSWGNYYKSYRNKHLLVGGMEPFFREFLVEFPAARGYQQKILLIDTLIHRYHWELEGEPGGPGAVGLIGGTRSEVIAFLNELTYGNKSTPGLAENRQRWRKKLGWANWSEDTVDERTKDHRWDGYDRLEEKPG